MKTVFSIIFCLLFFNGLNAQVDSAEVYRQLFGEDVQIDEDQTVITSPILVDEEEEEEEKGIPVFISLQPAVYFANNAMANFYNGSIKELVYEDRYVIQTIWDNPNNKRIIKDDLNLTDYQYDAVEFGEENFNYNMRYDIGYLIGFQAFFALKPRFHILLDFNFVTLNTSSVITLEIQDLNTPNKLVQTMDVFGKENRFIIDLGAHYLMGKRDLKYYIEGGPNFMMAKATDNYFITGEEDSSNHTWNLRRSTNNNNAANTITSFSLGAFVGAGLFFKMNDSFAFEFGPQMGINNIEYPGYSGFFTSYQINLRIIYLSKNSEL